MDHASYDTGDWLAYCGQCPVPEVANVFRRAGIPFRSVSGHLRHETGLGTHRPLGARRRHPSPTAHRPPRADGAPLPGHARRLDGPHHRLATFGSHVEILEFDDLRELVMAVDKTPRSTQRVDLARDGLLARRQSVECRRPRLGEPGSPWASTELVEHFDLDSRRLLPPGLAGELHERLGAGMILGASLLTARGVPDAGEYELRTSLAHARQPGARRRWVLLRDSRP